MSAALSPRALSARNYLVTFCLFNYSFPFHLMSTDFSVDTNPESVKHASLAASRLRHMVDKFIAPFFLEVATLQCNYFYHRIVYVDAPQSANES